MKLAALFALAAFMGCATTPEPPKAQKVVCTPAMAADGQLLMLCSQVEQCPAKP